MQKSEKKLTPWFFADGVFCILTGVIPHTTVAGMAKVAMLRSNNIYRSYKMATATTEDRMTSLSPIFKVIHK